MVKNKQTLARSLLEREFKLRKERNRAYSLRAYAKALAIPASRLSEYLAQKRAIPAHAANHLSAGLALTGRESAEFKASVLGIDLNWQADVGASFRSLNEDQYEAIADWQHLALLALLETAGAKPDPKWLAERLGISAPEARLALERLERLNLIERRKNKLILTGQALSVNHDIRSRALRRSHRQYLEKAITALDEVHVDLRDITSMIMAIDVSRLDFAKEKIKEFRRSLAQDLESGKRSEVYALQIQLVPISKLKISPKTKESP